MPSPSPPVSPLGSYDGGGDGNYSPVSPLSNRSSGQFSFQTGDDGDHQNHRPDSVASIIGQSNLVSMGPPGQSSSTSSKSGDPSQKKPSPEAESAQGKGATTKSSEQTVGTGLKRRGAVRVSAPLGERSKPAPEKREDQKNQPK